MCVYSYVRWQFHTYKWNHQWKPHVTYMCAFSARIRRVTHLLACKMKRLLGMVGWLPLSTFLNISYYSPTSICFMPTYLSGPLGNRALLICILNNREYFIFTWVMTGGGRWLVIHVKEMSSDEDWYWLGRNCYWSNTFSCSEWRTIFNKFIDWWQILSILTSGSTRSANQSNISISQPNAKRFRRSAIEPNGFCSHLDAITRY